MNEPTILETAALAWAEMERVRAIMRDGLTAEATVTNRTRSAWRTRRDRIYARLRAAVEDAWAEAEMLREELEEMLSSPEVKP